MKITGNSSFIKFDFENGYVLKAEGEMLVNRTFVVYKETMKFWEAPHDNESLSQKQIEDIILEVQKDTNENTIQLIFE